MSASNATTLRPLLQISGLTKHFPVKSGLLRRRNQPVQAVENVSFDIDPGEVVGLVGESGSGKTTVARTVLRLVEPTRGIIRLSGVDILSLDAQALRQYRRRMQIIFQDPYASLNPRLRVADILGEPFAIHKIGDGRDRRDRVAELLRKVGLPTDAMDRFPNEFSGGQRQRIGIARALAAGPEFVVADEAVSALDVSVQAQIINLLKELQRELNLTILFISHDLRVIRHVSNRVVVMYLGRVMEIAPTRSLFSRPRHPYTQALLSAVPIPNPDRQRDRIVLKGEIPSATSPPSGCVFRTRCPYAISDCAKVVPALRDVGDDAQIACIREGIL